MTPEAPYSLENCLELDRVDPLAGFRDKFAFAASGNIHFDANSMGAMTKDAPDRVHRLLTKNWRDKSRRSWSTEDWLEKPRKLGASISHMIGANSQDVVVCDNTTINLFKIISYAWKLRGSGNAILTEAHNFPTDMHVAQGFIKFLEELGVAGHIIKAETREQVVDKLDRNVALLYLTQTDYRSSERWDLSEMNKRAHAVDALTIWDLSHSAGALNIDLMGTGSDFAVGCGYKYLCGGPGGPAYLFINPEHQGKSWPTIAGWMGHAQWDKFSADFEPAANVAGHLTGTPQVVANEIFSAAADIWSKVQRADVADKHQSLTETLIGILEQECSPLGVGINSPRLYQKRGGHVSFSHAGAGQVCEALVDHGLISSFRFPNSIRLGLSPLYHNHEDVWKAVQIIKDVLFQEAWQHPKYENVSM